MTHTTRLLIALLAIPLLLGPSMAGEFEDSLDIGTSSFLKERAARFSVGNKEAKAARDKAQADEMASKDALKAAAFKAVLDGGKYVCKNPKGESGYNQIQLGGFGLPLKDRECADLGGKNLRDAGAYNYRGASVKGSDFNHTDLTSSDFTGADASGANFRFASLGGTIFHGANLTGADMSQAILEGADFSDADLRGANLRTLGVEKMIVTGAKFDDQTVLPMSSERAMQAGMVKVDKDGVPVSDTIRKAIVGVLKSKGIPDDFTTKALIAEMTAGIEAAGLEPTPEVILAALKQVMKDRTNGVPVPPEFAK